MGYEDDIDDESLSPDEIQELAQSETPESSGEDDEAPQSAAAPPPTSGIGGAGMPEGPISPAVMAAIAAKQGVVAPQQSQSPIPGADSPIVADPKVIAAIRAKRDQDIGLATLSHGITQIGAGLAGQKADSSGVQAATALAQNHANEALSDQKTSQAAIANFIKQKREDKKLTDLDKRRDELTAVERDNAETNKKRLEIAEKLGSQRLDMSGDRMDQGQDRLNMRKSQFEERQYSNVLNKIDKDPILKAKMQALQTIDSSAQLVAKAREEGKPVSKQQFEELQQGIISSLGQKGIQVGSERAAKMFESAGIDAKAAFQFLLGTPIDIGKDNPLYNHVMDLARWESDISRQQMDDHLNRLTAGNGYIFDKRPDLKAGLLEKLGAFKKEVQTTNFKPGAGDPRAQTKNPPGKSVASRQYSPSRNKTRVKYSDGTEEILDGKQ